MHKVKLRALLCQVGELNERELDELFDAVQKRQSATKALRVVENALSVLIGGVSARHLPKYLAWTRTFAGYQDKPKPEIYLISALGKQLINTF